MPAKRASQRVLELDQILAMRDVLKITGTHRCTIHRWMAQGLFPPKVVRGGRTIGWRRSDIDHWLRSDEKTAYANLR